MASLTHYRSFTNDAPKTSYQERMYFIAQAFSMHLKAPARIALVPLAVERTAVERAA